MFGEKKKDLTNSTDFSTNTFRKGTTITGDIKTEGNIRIDGVLEGSVSAKGKLVVGETGVINGNLFCTDATVEGKIEGNVEITRLLIIKSKSVIVGNILTDKIVVEEGASFNGKVTMGKVNKLNNISEKSQGQVAV
ncbi:MAG: polymer-forming cytoskeletal protein [Chitinophagales bacterium]|nr:polymer-forming cytoskeletal protein [Bacteroidota bacterium]MCB9227287.1 polymer-forming cytoskeletal protein [Chitinophagales bacterium]